MLHVPYKGSAPAITDVIAGRVGVMFDMVSAALPHYRAGKIRILGVTGSERSTVLPDVPIVAQTVPGFEATAWFGIVAPAGTPKPVVDRLNAEIVKALAEPDVRKMLSDQSLEPVGGTSAQFSQTIEKDLVKWAKVVKDAGVKP